MTWASRPNMTMARKVGHIMSTKVHRKIVPMNSPSSAMPACVMGSGAGRNRNTIMIAIPIRDLMRYAASIFPLFCASVLISVPPY